MRTCLLCNYQWPLDSQRFVNLSEDETSTAACVENSTVARCFSVSSPMYNPFSGRDTSTAYFCTPSCLQIYTSLQICDLPTSFKIPFRSHRAGNFHRHENSMTDSNCNEVDRLKQGSQTKFNAYRSWQPNEMCREKQMVDIVRYFCWHTLRTDPEVQQNESCVPLGTLSAVKQSLYKT